MNKDTGRFVSLDALRGVAALIVVSEHYRQTIPWLDSSVVLRRATNGNGAVLIFFVLSGFVLTFAYRQHDIGNYFSFEIKRVLRIWPTFAVAILASAALRLAIGHHDVAGASEAFEDNWRTRPNSEMLLSHLAMLGNDIDLDSPMWTLIHEMRISLAFPLIAVLVAWNWRAAMLAAVVMCLLTGPFEGHSIVVSSVLMSGQFSLLFLLGSVLAIYFQVASDKILSIRLELRLLLWLFAILGIALSADYSSPLALSGIAKSARFILHGTAAAILVLLCATEYRVKHWLSGRLLTYLGRISYSIYLWHVIILTAVLQIASGFAPLPVLMLASFMLTLVVSHFSERYIERPTMTIGRRLARFVAGRRSAVSQYSL